MAIYNVRKSHLARDNNAERERQTWDSYQVLRAEVSQAGEPLSHPVISVY